MNARRLVLVLVSCAALTACATCREHPIACAVSVVAVGAAATYRAEHPGASRVRDVNAAPGLGCPNPAPGACN